MTPQLSARSLTQTMTGRTLINAAGRFFRLISAANPVKVEFLDSNGGVIGTLSNFLAGLGVVDFPFSGVAITPTVAGEISYVIATSRVDYDRAAGSVDITNTSGAMVNSEATVATAATLMAADARRRYVFVQNNSAGSYLRVTLDGSTPTASHGIRIAPGDYWENPAIFAPVGEIKAIAESGSVAVDMVEG